MRAYGVDGVEPVMSAEERESPTWQAFRRALGYTTEWREKICRRMARLPPETGFGCDPRMFSSEEAG